MKEVLEEKKHKTGKVHSNFTKQQSVLLAKPLLHQCIVGEIVRHTDNKLTRTLVNVFTADPTAQLNFTFGIFLEVLSTRVEYCLFHCNKPRSSCE